MKTLIVDLSPILYANLISASTEVKRGGQKPLENGKLEYNYADIVMFKVFDELSKLKPMFGADEVVLAADNPDGDYWRKRVYSGYKNGRKKKRQDSDIDWDKAFGTFSIIKKVLDRFTSFKLIDVPTTEGDDVAFVLSKHLDHDVILQSLDHDWIQCLKYPRTEYFRTRKAQKKDGIYVTATPEELDEIELEHCIGGDPGDGFGHIKQWSKFSPEFIKEYPKYKDQELKLWPKRFEIDCMYEDRTGKSAYKHPRYGWKTYKKKDSCDQLFKENKIYELNFCCNRDLAMQDRVPQDIEDLIIYEYNTAKTTRDIKNLQKFFQKTGLFSLSGIIGLL